MRKLFLLFLLLLLFSPQFAVGSTKTVTVNWMMSDTTDVTGYKMYYSYSNSMAGKMLACETNDHSVTSLLCGNVEISQSPVYLEIVAKTITGDIVSTPVSQSVDISEPPMVSIVQGFALAIDDSPPVPDVPQPPAPALEYKINFQPPSAPVPAGYLPDSRRHFDGERGYGWIQGPASMGSRDRNVVDSSLGQIYDTMVHVKPTSIWEISVPNGTYSVTICNGDASFARGVQNVQAEGVTVIDNVVISSSSRWVERTALVPVTDGKLTVTFAGSDSPARLCWLRVAKVN